MSASYLRFVVYFALGLGLLTHVVVAFDNSRMDNLAIYWGQDSADSQHRLSFYCQDDTVDVIPLAFLFIMRGKGGAPVVEWYRQICDPGGAGVFPGTSLANCQAAMSSDIKFCQSQGKLVTLSIGGATGQVGFSSDSEAQTFATQIWNMFLGGSSSTRPFGDVVLDGIDLDIESGTPAHYATFVNKVRSLAAPTGQSVYITAAPQCPFPDQNIGAALDAAPFDAVYVQFYNNFCGLDAPADFNLATWDNWAKKTSANKHVKVYIGAPASRGSAGTGYVEADTLAKFAADAQAKYSSFGGVMMWDADSAFSNNRFDKAIKQAITASAAKLGGPPEPPQHQPASSSHSSSAHKASPSPPPSKPRSTSILSHGARSTSARFQVPTAAPLPNPPATVEPEPVHSLKSPDFIVSAEAGQWEQEYKASGSGVVNSRFFRL